MKLNPKRMNLKIVDFKNIVMHFLCLNYLIFIRFKKTITDFLKAKKVHIEKLQSKIKKVQYFIKKLLINNKSELILLMKYIKISRYTMADIKYNI